LLRTVPLDAILWLSDVLAVTGRTTARASDFAAVAESKTAVSAFTGFEEKAQRAVPRDGLDDVADMVFDLSFRYPDNFASCRDDSGAAMRRTSTL
jgi:hypothetical protein